MTSLQLDGAHGPVAWARSPTTVSEPLSERRATILSCIGERSCTSSTTMWPYVRISSALGDAPALPRHRAEHLAGVVEQGDVRGGPAHVGDVVGARAVEGGDLVVVEDVAAGEAQQRP